jgi:hypothetical protein
MLVWLSVSWQGGGMDLHPNVLWLAGAVLVVVIVWKAVGQLGKPRQLPYTRRQSLLTAAENRFYRALALAVPPELAVFVKVRLMDVIAVADDKWQEFGARGSGMHLDFVLADRVGLNPRLVIELDDRSHFFPAARQRDAFKSAALAAAGMPILRIPAAAEYRAEEIRHLVATSLRSEETAPR